MTSNRERQLRGAAHRARTKTDTQVRLESRRAAMHAAEGHAGSIPRGNQQPEREIMGTQRIAWDRVLGH
jgi:hypothetical protein